MLLTDSEMSALSISRRRHEGGFWHVIYRRDRHGHICVLCGGERYSLYGFLIRVGGLELHVWEKCRTDLFGLSGLESVRTMQASLVAEKEVVPIRHRVGLI